MKATLKHCRDLDKVLALLVENPNDAYCSDDIKQIIFQDEDDSYVEFLFKILVNHQDGLVLQMAGSNLVASGYIRSEPYTNIFLQNGGFVSEYEEQISQRKKENEKSSKEYEKLHLEIETLRNQLFDYPATKKRAIRGEVLAILGLLLSAIAIVISL